MPSLDSRFYTRSPMKIRTFIGLRCWPSLSTVRCRLRSRTATRIGRKKKTSSCLPKRKNSEDRPPKHVTRTTHIAMDDTMRCTPSAIKVRQGETIRFIVKNNGKFLHEIVLGTMAELKEHGELMKKIRKWNMTNRIWHTSSPAPGKKWCGSSPSRATSISVVWRQVISKPAW